MVGENGMLRAMTRSARVSLPLLQDTRHIRVGKNRALVFRVVNECGRTVGVCLDEVQLAGSMRKHFTNDDGNSFRRAAFGNANGCFKIEQDGPEEDLETLETVRKFFTIWHGASDHTDRRAKVRDTCSNLMNLISQSCQALPYLQDVGSISETSQTAPNDEFQQVEDRLTALLRVLTTVDACDGEGVISPGRFDQFLNDRD